MRSCVKLGAGGPFCCRGCAHSASWGRSELAMVWAWWAVAVLAVAGHQVSGHPVNGSGCASTRVVHVHLIMPLSGQCGSRRSAWFLAVRTPDPASLRFLAQPPNGQPQVLMVRSSYHPSGTVRATQLRPYENIPSILGILREARHPPIYCQYLESSVAS